MIWIVQRIEQRPIFQTTIDHFIGFMYNSGARRRVTTQKVFFDVQSSNIFVNIYKDIKLINGLFQATFETKI